MQKWINFMKVNIKYSRILWNLKKIFQYSQKYSPKGHLVKSFSAVTKNLSYDENCLLQKGKNGIGVVRRKLEEMGQKCDFRAFCSEI